MILAHDAASDSPPIGVIGPRILRSAFPSFKRTRRYTLPEKRVMPVKASAPVTLGSGTKGLTSKSKLWKNCIRSAARQASILA